MNTTVERRPLTLAFKPFIYVAGAPALGLGIILILLAGLIGYFSNTHFDGVLDTHTGAHLPPWVVVSEGIIDWACLSLVLLALGRMISTTKFRTLDLLGTQALARWPSLCVSLLTLTGGYQRFNQAVIEQLAKGGKLELGGPDAIAFYAVIVAMLPFICWMVALMYQSYAITCNLKGGKSAWSFIFGLIVAEGISKFALFALIKLAA